VGLGVSLEVRLLLLRVIIPAMMWWLHKLRLEMAAVQQQLHLLRAPTGEFVLRQLLNHDGMNKLF
jgi:hypothetical protein